MRAWTLAAVLLLAGCAAPEAGPRQEELELVDAPTGGGFAECAGHQARPLAFPFRAQAVGDARGLDPGLHRLDARTFLWVWASHHDTLREDRVTRIHEVQVVRAPEGHLAVCSQVDVAAPRVVDAQRRTYDVAVLFEALDDLPEGALRVVVNWVAGCECDPLPRGNHTAEYPA